MFPLHMLLAAMLGWLEREQRDVIAFLREENRTLKAQLARRRLQSNDATAPFRGLGQRLGRAVLREVATIVTPDTILRWHRDGLIDVGAAARDVLPDHASIQNVEP